MQLYTLLAGKSKSKLKPIMTDSLEKVTNYKESRERSGGSKLIWHSIVLASPGAVKWRKDNSNKWTGYDRIGPIRIK